MAESASRKNANKKLKKDLGLWDVYCISTGAMFSSGFFLLPGLATAYAGPSTVLAYAVAGILMVPAMLSMAELSTALPRAGGTYFFLDRSLGPGVGTVGGLGTWLALVLKSAFALLGMGAYLAIAPGVATLLPGDEDQKLWVIKGLAVALTVAFAALNLFGAKETTKLQGILVVALLSVLSFFLVQGIFYVLFRLPEGELQKQFTPFMHQENGFGGFFATVGLVFVSYAGLTKVASVSEEVKQPDRNLPLGMFLSLLTATAVYVDRACSSWWPPCSTPASSAATYTPVATAAERLLRLAARAPIGPGPHRGRRPRRLRLHRQRGDPRGQPLPAGDGPRPAALAEVHRAGPLRHAHAGHPGHRRPDDLLHRGALGRGRGEGRQRLQPVRLRTDEHLGDRDAREQDLQLRPRLPQPAVPVDAAAGAS